MENVSRHFGLFRTKNFTTRRVHEPDKEICDECDINFQPPKGCDALAGSDHYPNYGWIAVDEKEWKAGENRTYNFGASFICCDGYEVCLEATYTLTAEEEEEEKLNSPATVALHGMFTLISLLLSLWIL